MKTKSIFFSNFKYKSNSKQDNYNNLIIDNYYNTNSNQGLIQSSFSQENILKILFDNETAQQIEILNSEILNKTIRFIPYEYFDENELKIKLRLFAITQNNSFYELETENLIFSECYKFNSQANIIQSNNILYLFDLNNTCILIEQNNIITIESIPNIKSFAYDSNYLFFVLNNQPNKLFITEACELKEISSNLEQYSQISISIEDGFIENIFCLKNKIYIFTQYSILKLDLESNKLIRQNKLNLSLFKNSIEQLDDYILFYSSNGLYIFDGIDIRQIFNNQLNLSENAKFIYFNHNLYIFDLKFKNIIYQYNLENDAFCKIKIENLSDIYLIKNYSNHFLALQSRQNNIINTLAINSDPNKYLSPEQYIRFKPLFFNSDTLKQINKIYVNSSGTFQLKISSEVSTCYINISNNSQISDLSLNGTFFNFEIISNSAFSLESFLITYSELGE